MLFEDGLFVLQCTVTCGGGIRTRNVSCTKNSGEPCNISKKPHSKALCGLQQCPSIRRLQIPHFKVHGGKIIRTGGNPRRGPMDKPPIPKPSQRTTTPTIPEPRYVTLIPTSFNLMNFSQEDPEAKILHSNSSNLNIPSNYSFSLSGISHQQNTTLWPITNHSSIPRFKKVENASIELYNSSKGGLVHWTSFTISPMPLTATPSYNYSKEVSHTASNQTGEGTIGSAQSKMLTRYPPTTAGKTSEISPMVHHNDTATQASVDPVAGTGISLTTVDLQEFHVQISTPATVGPVMVSPTQSNEMSGSRSSNKTELKPSANETSAQSTENPFLWIKNIPKNETSMGILPNVSDYPEESRDLHPDAYWMVGNWSDVSVGFFS